MSTASSRMIFISAALAMVLTPSVLRADFDDDDFDDDDDVAYTHDNHRHVDAEVRVYRQGERPTYSYEYYESSPRYSYDADRDRRWQDRDDRSFDSSGSYYDERDVAGAADQRDGARPAPQPNDPDRGTTYYYYNDSDRYSGYDSRYDREPQYDRRETYYYRDSDDDDDDDVTWHHDRETYRQDRHDRYESRWHDADDGRYTDTGPRYDERREYRTEERQASPDYRYREYSFSYRGDVDDDDFDD